MLGVTGIILGVTGLWEAQDGEEQEENSHPSPTNTPIPTDRPQPVAPLTQPSSECPGLEASPGQQGMCLYPSKVLSLLLPS